MGESPFFAPSNPARFRDNSGESQLNRIAGTLQVSNDGGATYGAIGGSAGGAVPWANNVANFVRGRDSTLMATTLFEECTSLTNGMISLDAGGGGSVTLGTTKPGGYIILASGAGAGTFRTAFAKGDAAEASIPNLRTSHFALATKAKITQTQADFNLLLCTLGDHTTGALGICAHHSVSGVNYSLEVFATTQDSGVPLDVTNQRTYLVMGDGTTVTFWIGAADGTNLTTLFVAGLAQSAAAANKGIWLSNAQNVSAAAIVAFEIDSILQMTQAAG